MEYYKSPRLSSEIIDCSLPMTLDTYSNCSFKCLYCFSQFQRGVGAGREQYLKNKVKFVNTENVKKIFLEKNHKEFGEYVKAKKVIQWGGLSDQFDRNEKKYGKTLELLRFFREIDYPITFSTKATWWLDDERYIELFKNNSKWNVKFSIITLDAEKAKYMESGVDSPQNRLKAIEKFANLNAGGATLRLRPFIIGVSTPTYLDLIKEAHNAGATALSTEFLCLEARSPTLKEALPLFNKLCGFDIFEFYKKYSNSTGYYRLNRAIKKPFFDNMKNLCDEIGMRFYCSDPYYKEHSCGACCCGLDEKWNYTRGHFAEALILAKRNGSVRFSEIEKDLQLFKNTKFVGSGINTGTREKESKFINATIYDYIRWLWNSPNIGTSPYKEFGGVLIPSSKDENGDIVYKYEPK